MKGKKIRLPRTNLYLWQKVVSFSIMVLMILLFPDWIYCHGVEGKVGAGGIVVTAQYMNGEALSYAKVIISAPGAKQPFQSGRTDRNGRFCFFPDSPGDWKVVIDDELGHRLEIIVPVNEKVELQTAQKTGKPNKSPLLIYERAITGISIIFGVSGIFLWWRGRRIHRKLPPFPF